MDISNISSNPPSWGLEKVDHKLQKHIARNFLDGNVSTGEAFSLEKGMVNINKMEQNARADGHVTLQEAGQIFGAQMVEARKIFNDAHNNPQPQPVLADSPAQPDVASASLVDVNT